MVDHQYNTSNSPAKHDSDFDLYWSKLTNKTICITGATGLIGSHLVHKITNYNKTKEFNCTILLPVRNINKAKSLFGNSTHIRYYEWNLGQFLPIFNMQVDFIIHAACPTASQEFEHKPVETIINIVEGTQHILQSCKHIQPHKFVYLSTMEVYGETGGLITEDSFGSIDPMVVRNSYPEAKRLCECLCASYYQEYDLPICVARLAQTFGAGVNPEDKRVFAEFGRAIKNSADIVLFSDGSKKNSYISLNDVANAIATILCHGEPGEAYNVANEDTYTSIKDMANMVIESFGNKQMKVRFATDSAREKTFRKSKDLNLCSSKLKDLDWEPTDSLKDMFAAMLDCWNMN